MSGHPAVGMPNQQYINLATSSDKITVSMGFTYVHLLYVNVALPLHILYKLVLQLLTTGVFSTS